MLKRLAYVLTAIFWIAGNIFAASFAPTGDGMLGACLYGGFILPGLAILPTLLIIWIREGNLDSDASKKATMIILLMSPVVTFILADYFV